MNGVAHSNGIAVRNGTAPGGDPASLVPLQGGTTDPTSMARDLAKNPSDLACLLVELQRLGVDVLGGRHRGQPLLDTRVSPSPRDERGSTRRKKPWRVLPEHERLASEVIPFFRREGELLFLHVGARPDGEPERLRDDLAGFFRRHTLAFVCLLDWGGVYGHEHAHSVVWVANRAKFMRSFHEWLAEKGITWKAHERRAVTGWGTFLATGRISGRWGLGLHLANCIAYAEAPPDDGHVRDLTRHAIAGGMFEKPWRAFVRNATRNRAGSVTPRGCESCRAPLPGGATKRRRFCEGSACRVRHHRRGKEGARKSWRLKLPKTYVRWLRDFLGGRPGRAGRSSAVRRSLDTPTPRASARATKTMTES